MQIVVCLKQTLDPEIPPKDFRIDPATAKPVQGNAKLVLDSYGENALELAVQLKEKLGAKLTVITLGDKPADDALRRAYALTADAAVRVWDPGFADLDANGVAHVLAAAVQALGGADLVLAGRQAADLERGSVGPMLAEELGAACVTFVAKAAPAGERLRLEREVEGGFEVVECKLPAVLTVTSHESNGLRVPKVKDTMMAMRKPIDVKGAADLRLDQARLQRTTREREVYVPKLDRNCEIVGGDDGAAKAANLVEKLRALKVL